VDVESKRNFLARSSKMGLKCESRVKTKLHAYGTNIEGEWDDVFAAIKRCHEAVHAMGAPRISSSLRFGTRTDRPQTMDDKVRSVEAKLG